MGMHLIPYIHGGHDTTTTLFVMAWCAFVHVIVVMVLLFSRLYPRV